MVKKIITKRNYPLWLLLLGFGCALVFMNVLDHTPGSMVFWLGALLFVGDGSLIAATVIGLIRAIKGISGWVKSSENNSERRKRILGMIAGLIVAAPLLFYWFVALFLAFGFLSIAIYQRQFYH
jgi:membrane-bound ClpP family serine protease